MFTQTVRVCHPTPNFSGIKPIFFFIHGMDPNLPIYIMLNRTAETLPYDLDQWLETHLERPKEKPNH